MYCQKPIILPNLVLFLWNIFRIASTPFYYLWVAPEIIKVGVVHRGRLERFLFQTTADTDPRVPWVSNDQKKCDKFKYLHSQVDHPAKFEEIWFFFNFGPFLMVFPHDIFILLNFGWIVDLGMKLFKFFTFLVII